MNVKVNVLIELLYGNYYYHYYCHFILQNNIKITLLTFMNVDGAFILAETRRKTSVLLFVDRRFKNDSDEFGMMFVARIAFAHAFKKLIKMLLSN